MYKEPKSKISSTDARDSRTPSKLNIFRALAGKSKKSEAQDQINDLDRARNVTAEQSTKLLTANCCICDSGLKFEANASCFRCTVCDTVNDLRSPPTNESPPPLSTAELETLASTLTDELHRETTIEALTQRITTVFSNAQCLNNSLSSGKPISHSECSVNLHAVRKMYRLLGRDVGLMRVTIEATNSLLNRPGKKIRAVQDARFLLILLENPYLQYRIHKVNGLAGQFLLKRLLGLISSLPHDVHKYLVNWFGRSSKEIFHQRIDLINGFLAHRLAKLSRNPAREYHSCWQVKAASRTMALFFSANVIKVMLPISSFYNSFTDYIDLDKDYIAWKNRRSQYSFCQYPFFISLKQKQKILAIDAYRQMALKQREVYFNALDGKIEDSVFRITVRRSHLLQDSLAVLSENETQFKKKLIVQFEDEEGVDAGGLRKEYFLLLCRQLFDTWIGLFCQDEDSRYCWFNPSANDQKFLSYYYLLGVVIGLAIYNSVMLDVNLPPALFKKLIGQPCSLLDLKVLHPGLANGLQHMLNFDGDVESTFCRNFVLERQDGDDRSIVPLCPGGANIPVTNANRKEFVQAYVNYIFNESCSRSMFHISRGFHQVAGGNALSLFRAEEVELLVRGSPEPLCIDDLKSVCIYDGFPMAKKDPLSEPLVKNFWTIFEELDPTRQKGLLSFITGSDRVPATGTIDLCFRISVDRAASRQKLPIAHTCFSQLVLPLYTTLEELRSKLRYAMDEGSTGFTIA